MGEADKADFVRTKCWKCHEPFYLSPDSDSMLRRTGITFFCPWGHEGRYIPPEEQSDPPRPWWTVFPACTCATFKWFVPASHTAETPSP